MKLRRSACIDTLYLELPFLDRFQAAKEDGFDAVEFWSWADWGRGAWCWRPGRTSPTR